MRKFVVDMIYLASCGVNKSNPDAEFIKEIDLEELYNMSCAHSVEALIGMVLKQAGVSLSKEWNEKIAKAIRKTLLFDAERAKLFSFMEQKGIWYLPLKGIILKDYYPALGMRQMSDNDILFDSNFGKEIQKYMVSQGYKVISVEKGNHDEYEKEPVYHFEMHRSLYGFADRSEWSAYYNEVKKKLILNSGSSYAYHFTDEDFYIYIISHAYKHYSACGTGIRTLLDIYVYLEALHQKLDYAYIEQECAVLGLAEFEYQNRKLCKKIFGINSPKEAEELEQQLSAEEKEMFFYYVSSGAYGALERSIEKSVEKFREKGNGFIKLRYYWNRLFPSQKTMEQNYLHIYKHKIFLPFAYVYRLWMGAFNKKRRKKMVNEIKLIKKIK